MEGGLSRGLWKISYTTFPGQGGNTVIVGHSMNYSTLKPPPFFYLNRVEKGDSIYVEYKGRVFKYIVEEVVVAKMYDTHYEKTDVKVEIITLYTCTPIINPVNRLIIIGKVVSID